MLTGKQPGLVLRHLHGTSPLQRVYFKSLKSILPMSTHRQPRGFQGHRSPVLVSPGQSLHSFYPLDPILGRHSLSLLASWPGSDLPAGGVPSSPASHCPPAVFRVLCFRFLYSGLLYFKSLEVTSSESRLLSTQGRSILTEYHFPSGALTTSCPVSLRIRNFSPQELGTSQKGQRLHFLKGTTRCLVPWAINRGWRGE